MMEEKNSSKKVLLSVLGVAILIVAVVGISFAVFSFTNTGAGENSIQTGTITMSYSEPTAGLNLTEQLPITDVEGKAMDEYFEFTVSSTTTGNVAVPYEISITPVAITPSAASDGTCSNNAYTTQATCETNGGTWSNGTAGLAQLPASNVKLYLTSVANEVETEAVAPSLASTFTQTSTLRPVGSPASYVFKTVADATAIAETTTTTYRLRMWIDNATDVSAWTQNTNYQYKVLVNVDSSVAALS